MQKKLFIKKIYRDKYFRWLFRFLMVGILLVFILLVVSNKKTACDKCNVILVSLDTLSALHLECYGYDRKTAPNLCSFADKNIFFLNSYSQSSITLDSHFSIFTSLYPHTHKMTEVFKEPLNEKFVTLAQLLRMNGYKTIYHGPLNDINLPLNRGIERGFDVREGETIDTWDNAYSKLIKNNKEKKPTFIFLHTYAVHSPYLTGYKYEHLFTNQSEYQDIPLTIEEYRIVTPKLISFISMLLPNVRIGEAGETIDFKSDLKKVEKIKQTSDFNEEKKIFESMSDRTKGLCFSAWYFYNINKKDPERVKYVKALYDEQIYNLDQKIKKLINLVNNPELSKNTILIFTADHGEEFMEHGMLDHSFNLYMTSTQVPLIMHIPDVKPEKIKELVQGIDIYPTVINLIGINQKSKLEGIDLTGIIFGKKDANKNNYLRSEIKNIVEIQDDKFRFYYNTKIGNKSIELYDYNSDQQEKINIKSNYPQKIANFIYLLNKQ